LRREADFVIKSKSRFEKIGIPPPLAMGYLGLLLFMIGDGVEAGFLSPLLFDMHFKQSQVALVFTLYGATAALAAWLSGTLSDLFGPKKVMWAGLLIWIACEIPFLLIGIAHANYPVIAISYMLRGFGYPLFAFGFLVWVTAITPQRYLATAVGWFWVARTGGLPTLGSLLASFSVPRYGAYVSLWLSTIFVLVGGAIALFGTHEKQGLSGLQVNRTGHPLAVLFSGISIVWQKPRVGLGGLIAVITTTSEFGFLLFLPIFYIHTIGFSLQQWLQILSVMFATNVVFNLIWGYVGDRIGWRTTVALVGSCGCALATLGLFYIPDHFGKSYLLVMLAGMAYGATLAGFVPLGAIMATLAPESRGAAMSIMNLGSGTSIWLGPAIAGVFLPRVGVSGVIWIFALMYVFAALIAMTLRLPSESRIE
jgi:polyol permease family